VLRIAIAVVAAGVAFAMAGSTAHANKKRVAVMPFESASTNAEYAALGKGLQAMITTDLNNVGAYDLVERSRLADIQSELKLTKTGAIDKKTAARIGKLAGATHLLTGTVTVMGDKMRIDARMFATQSGKIMLTEQISGSKDEFFDLPKQLVKKMVTTTGVKMTPKVRVKVSRVHTADFKAFKTYSDGIAAYDAKQYKKSIQLLKAAAKIDPDFKLANMTLADYEERIAKMKTLAQTTAVNKRKADEIKRNAGAAKEARKLELLWEKARTTGKAARVERLWALYNLFRKYDDAYSRLRNLARIEDRFEMERIADALGGQYFAEAQKAFPRVPLLPLNHSSYSWNREPKNERDQDRLNGVTLSARYKWEHMCRRLQLTAKACGQFIFKAATKLKKAGADQRDTASVYIRAGMMFRRALDIDASTVAFSNAQKLTKDPYTSKTMVKEVEANRNVKKFLKECKGKLRRESMLLTEWRSGWKYKSCDDYPFRDLADDSSLQAAYAMRRMRGVPRRHPMLVGDTPVWIYGHRDVVTGPRTDYFQTNSIIYFEAKKEKYGVLAMVGGDKAAAPKFSFETSFAPITSWYPNKGKGRYSPKKGQTAVKYEKDRPRIVVGVGLVDVDVSMRNDENTGDRVVGRPMRGYGVMLDAKGVHLVEITEDSGKREIVRTNSSSDLFIAWKRLNFKVLETKSSSAQGKDTVKWKVSAKGKSLKVNVGGTNVTFKLPKPLETGYVGVWFDGAGYAQLSSIKGR